MTLASVIKDIAKESRFKFIGILSIVLLAVAVMHLLWRISDYSCCFLEAEALRSFGSAVFLHGKSFSMADIIAVLDSWGTFGDAQPRFLSFFFTIFALKLRVILWDWLPPHPSFTPTWLFSLVLAPWLLYRFLSGVLPSRWFAIAGTGVYMMSAGYLSSATMLFHQGKPLANVALIATLYVAMREEKRIENMGVADADCYFSRYLIIYLVGILPILLLSENTALFCLFIVPVWHHRFFIPRSYAWSSVRPCIVNTAIYAIPVIFFFLITFVIMPLVTASLLDHPFNFNAILNEYPLASKFDAEHIACYVTTLFAACLMPWKMLGVAMPVADGPHFSIPLLCILFVLFIWSSVVVFRQNLCRNTYVKTVILLFIFIFFQGYIAVHHNLYLVVSGYYYGAMFSVLFAVLFACIINSLQDLRWGRLIIAGLVTYIAAMQMTNFSDLNNHWKKHNNFKLVGMFTEDLKYNPFLAYTDNSALAKIFDQYPSGFYYEDIPDELRRGGFKWVKNVWKSRSAGYRDLLAHHTLALEDVWLLEELYYWRTPGRINVESREYYRRMFSTIGVTQGMNYLAAMSRVHKGMPDEEPLPVISTSNAPASLPEGSRDFYAKKLAYFWSPIGVADALYLLSSLHFTHLLVAGSQEIPGNGRFGQFNTAIRAVITGSAVEFGLKKIGSFESSGSEVDIYELPTTK